MKFILSEMTFLRYFLPIIIQCNKNGIKSEVYWYKGEKYSSPFLNMEALKNLSCKYDFKIYNIEEFNSNKSDIIFFLEGCGIDNVKNGKKYTLTTMRDFTAHYEKYKDKVDGIFMISRFFAEHYNKLSDKNIYIGSPKYDVVIDSKDILCKYGIRSKKNLIIMFPQKEFLNSNRMNKISKMYDLCHDAGYNLIVKSRGKNPVCCNLRGDQYFEDLSWFPHTSMELMTIADVVINFDSTSVKECIMMNVPIININVKDIKMFNFLYDNSYSRNYSIENADLDLVVRDIAELSNKNLECFFQIAREKFLFNSCNVSEKILKKVFE